MNELAQFIIDQGLDKAIDLVKTHSADIFLDKKAWQDAKHSLKMQLEAGGDMSDIIAYDKGQSQKVSMEQKENTEKVQIKTGLLTWLLSYRNSVLIMPLVQSHIQHIASGLIS